MFPLLWGLFSHLRSHYRLLAFGPALLTLLAVVFFVKEPLSVKLVAFLVIAG